MSAERVISDIEKNIRSGSFNIVNEENLQEIKEMIEQNESLFCLFD